VYEVDAQFGAVRDDVHARRYFGPPALPIVGADAVGADAVGRIGYNITQDVSPDGIVAELSGSASKAAAGDLADNYSKGSPPPGYGSARSPP
jgi:hypothetical protein